MINKKLSINQPKQARVKLFDYKAIASNAPSRTLPIERPTEYRNLICSEGALLLGYGVKPIKHLNSKTYPINDVANVAMRYYKGKDGKKDFLVAYYTSGGCFVLDMSDYADVNSLQWKRLAYTSYRTVEEFRVNGENILIFTGGTNIAKFDGENFTYTGEALPIITQTQCNHFGRMFISGLLNTYELRFSDEMDPLNFNVSAFEGGYINLDIDFGGVIKLVSMNEYLYIVCKRGIMRLRAYGDQSEFQLKKLNVFTGEIYEGTVVRCGSKIIFFSTAGLMAFDGYSCAVIHEEIKDVTLKNLQYSIRDLHAEYCYNTYFLSYWKDEISAEILAVDLDKNTYTFTDSQQVIGMVKIERGGENLLLYNTYDSSKFALKPLLVLQNGLAVEGVIKAEGIDFNEPERKKVITSIEIPDGFKGKLKISNGVTQPKTLTLTGKKFVAINCVGKVFDIELHLTSKKPSVSPIINVEMQRGV